MAMSPCTQLPLMAQHPKPYLYLRSIAAMLALTYVGLTCCCMMVLALRVLAKLVHFLLVAIGYRTEHIPHTATYAYHSWALGLMGCLFKFVLLDMAWGHLFPTYSNDKGKPGPEI